MRWKNKEVNNCGIDLEETVELGSQQVTRIQVFYRAKYGEFELYGLIFVTGKKEIARIGLFTINQYRATTTIQLAQGERWVGVSSSTDSGRMYNFQLITARQE